MTLIEIDLNEVVKMGLIIISSERMVQAFWARWRAEDWHWPAYQSVVALIVGVSP